MNKEMEKIQKVGNTLVDVFHFLALFIIGGTVVWSALYEYMGMMSKGYAALKDILLLFIYLELGAMIPEELFKAVAEILAHVYSLKNKSS